MSLKIILKKKKKGIVRDKKKLEKINCVYVIFFYIRDIYIYLNSFPIDSYVNLVNDIISQNLLLKDWVHGPSIDFKRKQWPDGQITW